MHASERAMQPPRPPRQRSKWPAVLVGLAGVGVLAFSAYLLTSWPPEPPESGVDPDALGAGQAATAASITAAERPLLAVLGDEFSAESDASTGPEWPQILGEELGWEVVVDAVDGSGYLTPGTGQSFAARVPAVLERSPDVIIVAGGENDLGRHSTEEITAAADEALSRLVDEARGDQVVLVSPFSKGAPGPLTAELTDALEQLAAENGLGFVDASGWLVASGRAYGADPAHPDDDGQALIARNMQTALERLGIADQP
jgi:lysophospholipase L1-like esterase